MESKNRIHIVCVCVYALVIRPNYRETNQKSACNTPWMHYSKRTGALYHRMRFSCDIYYAMGLGRTLNFSSYVQSIFVVFFKMENVQQYSLTAGPLCLPRAPLHFFSIFLHLFSTWFIWISQFKNSVAREFHLDSLSNSRKTKNGFQYE